MPQLLCPVIVGRDGELAVLRETVEQAASGTGGAVFLVGEAGMGKSRLALEATSLAEAAGLRVLRGRAVQRATPRPYRPLAEALQSALPFSASPEDPELQPFARALRWLLPDTGDEASEPGELAVAEALTRTLGVLGRSGGCLLLLEDLHWADPETLAVVEYLADHLPRQPALLVGTVRSGEAGAAERLARLLAERRAATLISLQRLSAEATDEMLAACLARGPVPPRVREFVHAHAEGVPLFVEELVAGLADSGALVPTGEGWRSPAPLTPVVPLTYVEAIRRRLDALGADDREVVLAAAVLGRRFDWSLLPAVTGRDVSNVLGSLRRAMASLLVEPVDAGTEFRFRHALARDAVLRELLPPEQATLAVRALDAVESAHPGLPGEWADLAADLAERAGDRPRAVGALLEVGREALRRGAVGSGQAALDRAATLARHDPGLSLLVDEARAQAAALAGDVDGAIRLAASVLAGLPAGAASADRRARLHLALARAALVAGRWRDASRHVDDALSLTRMVRDALRAAAQALASQVAIADGRAADAASLAQSAVQLSEAAGAPAAACEALEVLGRLARRTDLEDAERHFDRALRIAEQHDLALWRARALHELGTIDLYRGRRSDRFLDAREAAAEAGAVATVALCDLHLAVMSYAEWDPEHGVEAGRRCVDLSRRLGLDTLGMGLVHLAGCHAQGGQAAEMEEALVEAARVAGDAPDVAAGIPGRARAALALRLADLTTAGAALDDAVAVLRRHPDVQFPLWGLWALLRTAHDEDGERARAEARVAPGWANAFNRCCLDLSEAVANGRAGRGDEGADVVAAALRHLGPRAEGTWGAVLLAVVASSALRDGWGDGARWARRALATFEAAGLEELASWCRSLLRDAGHPVPRRAGAASPAPADLRAVGVTRREVDVLQLLAAGATNQEIARSLHLSPRTVERHVSNLLTKTAAANRRELARLARRAGVPAAPGGSLPA